MSEAAPLESVHILLVEDHALVRSVLEQCLNTYGARVTALESADEAVIYLNSNPIPAVLFSDIRMPGKMNGIDLARWATERFPCLPILLQTAFADMGSTEFPILYKPFEPEQLIATIQSLLLTKRTAE